MRALLALVLMLLVSLPALAQSGRGMPPAMPSMLWDPAFGQGDADPAVRYAMPVQAHALYVACRDVREALAGRAPLSTEARLCRHAVGGWLMGVEAVRDDLRRTDPDHPVLTGYGCPPLGISTDEIALAFVRQMERQPALGNATLHEALDITLKATYPCREDPPWTEEPVSLPR